ncbi:MAG TPA: hypothetical protein PLI51_06545 [bacterium]|mgnify:CR=1 FL=1|nr:hypothetical protein [bacterium]HPQ66367.1 hypothetical protein [bacterium]
MKLIPIIIAFLGASAADAAAGAPTPLPPAVAAPTPPPARARRPAPTPVPRGTPFDLAFYFARPGRIFSWSRAEGAGAWRNDTDWIITEERPFLTQDAFFRAVPHVSEERAFIRVRLTNDGNNLMDEAVLGNIGRTAVMVWNGRIRDVFTLGTRFHPNDIVIGGNLNEGEAQIVSELINYRPTPSPTTLPSPTPTPTPRPNLFDF